MQSKTTNILDLINAQDGNFTKALLNLGTNTQTMFQLDEFFAYPLEQHRTPFKESETLIASLYLETHKGYCLCMINFLRSNISVSLMLLRKTIEATLTAYHLCKYPGDEKIFTDRKHPRYKKIFWNIKKYVEENPKNYPLAMKLIKMHDLASKFASHSTVESHFINLNSEKGRDGEDNAVTLDFIEPLDHKTFEAWYFSLIKDFVNCYEIFWKEFFGKKFKIIDEDYGKRYANFCLNLEIRLKKITALTLPFEKNK